MAQGNRRCASCGLTFRQESYSVQEWYKGSGASSCRRCRKAEQERARRTAARSSLWDSSKTARHNNSSTARFKAKALARPFASGSFRWVAKGHYTGGPRDGEACVCKWFKEGSVGEDTEREFYDADIATSRKAIGIIRRWNEMNVIPEVIRVNLPEIWAFGPKSIWAGRKVLQEPYISRYQKFNSNSGWSNDRIHWGRVMQALSHYSYHVTKGKYLLCDLQGGVYSNGVVLTDPVIMSLTKSYGPTDLGPRGIRTFFARHRCSEFCQSHWIKPAGNLDIIRGRGHFAEVVGTTMVKHQTVNKCKPPGSPMSCY